jgi:uncharacterized protein (DUF2147 family)
MRIIVAAFVASLSLTAAAAADDIEGRWRTESGAFATIASCGKAFCITLSRGAHTGKRIGRMNAEGERRYSGEITDPENNKTYAGKASLNGASLSMKGCVLGGLICREQNWTRM